MLKVSTKNFDPNNKLGEGGFGSVFKVLNPFHVILNNLHNHMHQVVYKPRDPMLHVLPGSSNTKIKGFLSEVNMGLDEHG